MPANLNPYAWAFLFAAIGGSLTGFVTHGIWKRWGRSAAVHYDPWTGLATGIVERVLYLGALLAGHPAFVGLWLGLKFAGWWKVAAEDIRSATAGFFAGFGISNGLSLSYAAAGYLVVRFLEVGRAPDAWKVVGAVLGLTLISWLLTLPKAPQTIPGQSVKVPPHVAEMLQDRIPKTKPPVLE